MTEKCGKWITNIRIWKEGDVPELILECTDSYMVNSCCSNLPRIRRILNFPFKSYTEGLNVHLLRPPYTRKDIGLDSVRTGPYPERGFGLPKIDDMCITCMAFLQYCAGIGEGSIKHGFEKIRKTVLSDKKYRDRYNSLYEIMSRHFESAGGKLV